jgi:hypothetical protein
MILMQVEALCKLSCINLQHSQTSIQSVVDDINVILRCADSIKVCAFYFIMCAVVV